MWHSPSQVAGGEAVLVGALVRRVSSTAPIAINTNQPDTVFDDRKLQYDNTPVQHHTCRSSQVAQSQVAQMGAFGELPMTMVTCCEHNWY